MKSVFLVESGERYEGSVVIGVYRSRGGVVQAAMDEQEDHEGKWVKNNHSSY
jgi:hypothetical protein